MCSSPNRPLSRFLLCRCSTVVAGIVLAGLAQVRGETVFARSASRADVGAAVALAKDGDTVSVPAGSATWTTSLKVTNNIIFQGAGAASTIITNDITGGSSRPPLLAVSLARDLPFRMTGFTFKGGSATAPNFNGEIRITGNCHSFRIDHCTFQQLHGTSLAIRGFLWGVIDHCIFSCIVSHPITVEHDAWNGKDHGNGSWADDPYWGSEKFVFIEDNTFEGGGGIDSFEGARFVVRYNTLHNCALTMHGTEGQGRGAKQIEEYNNVYRNDIPDSAGQIRSGCIISHDNKWSHVATGHVLQVYRLFQRSPHWGISDGQNSYDENDSNSATGYWETGKHTGANGSTVLMDSTKHWASNQWCVPGMIYVVRNITQEAAASNKANPIQSFALSNTSNTVTCSSLSFTGAHLTFNTGDTYQIWRVTHSLDQSGVGKGDLLIGLPGLPAKWPNQVSEPCYSWSNTALEDGKARDLAASEPSIKEGRDFFNGTSKPGYKPFTYPHPLTVLAPPSNLQVAGQP